MRGVLAEYLVGLALDCVDGGVRTEWMPPTCAQLKASGWK